MKIGEDIVHARLKNRDSRIIVHPRTIPFWLIELHSITPEAFRFGVTRKIEDFTREVPTRTNGITV